MTVNKEFEAFRAMMMAQFARLAENAGRYIGSMNNKDRKQVIVSALNFAWDLRADFDPVKHQLPKFWDNMLRMAVMCENVVELRRTSEWETVPSKLFLTWIQPIGVPSDE